MSDESAERRARDSSGYAPEPIGSETSSAPDVSFPARNRGTYRVLGEVARGGMGAILRGYDRELRRDVAIKVLDEELAKRPEVVQRFVEEAQVGAQLQHPGVVPVYELGVLADERPFFTMKLVEGRTLAFLLGARASPDAEQRRFLAIFEQICQTMAYAHSKGVLHRDLKPANVMIGAFGEVQVVDWGLAKVLDRGGVESAAASEPRSHVETVRSGPDATGNSSVAGAIMGTPAYMPPEQARGELESLDGRADVFALGAILCEILSGAPPYVGGGGASVLEQAARGHLVPARARLVGARADEELAELCLGCLAPEPQDRPASAEEVARAIHAFLSRAEERAREAQLAAAEARVHAAEEGKRRRLTLALAVAIVVSLLALGGGYVFAAHQRERRLENVRRQVDGMEAGVAELQRAGRHDDALASARDTLAFVEAEGVGGDLAPRVQEFVRTAEVLAGEARVRRELEARNHAFFERLDEIDLQRSFLGGVSITTEELDRAYAAAFRDYGLDVEAQDVVEILATLRERGMGTELALALDRWARVRRALFGWDAAEPEVLTALSADLDPDPVRTEVRATLLRQDKRELFRLQDEIDFDGVPPETLWVLASAVADVEGDPRVFLERAVQRHPGDPRFRVLLGIELLDKSLPGAAIPHFEAAHALEPDNAAVIQRLASALGDVGDFPGQLRLARELEARVPEFVRGTTSIGFALLMLGDYEGALATYERLRPRDVLTVGNLIELEGVRYLAGEITSTELSAALAAIPAKTVYKEQAECWALCARPDTGARDLERALAQIERVLPAAPDDRLTRYCLALANLRLARHAEMLEALAPVPAYNLRGDIAFSIASLRAIAHHHLGHDGVAREWLDEARHLFQSLAGAEPEAWDASIFVEHLREAEALIE